MTRRRKKIPSEAIEAKIDSLSHEGRGIAHVEYGGCEGTVEIGEGIGFIADTVSRGNKGNKESDKGFHTTTFEEIL